MTNNAILVGNSSQPVGRGLGNIVDSFDFVIRINDFVLEGFEKDYGSKTDIWVTNGGVVRHPRDPSVFKESWVCSPDFDRTVAGIERRIPLEAIQEVNHLFRTMFKGGSKYPTTGLYCALFFARRFSKLFVLGLNDIGSKVHYFEEDLRLAKMSLAAHDPKAESSVFNHLVGLGLIVPV